METKPSPKWTVEDRERALTVVALYSGSTRAAVEQLREEGLDIPEATIRSWKSRYRERYSQLRSEMGERIRSEQAEGHARLAAKAAVIVDKMISRLEQHHDEIEIDKVPAAAKSLATVSGIHSDKARDLRGDPSVVEHRHLSFEELQRSLRSKGVEIVIDASAEELPEPTPVLPSTPEGQVDAE